MQLFSTKYCACYKTPHEALNLKGVILLTKYYQDVQTKDKRSGTYQNRDSKRTAHRKFMQKYLGKKTTWNR
jgi:hypothetical protein